jgi:deazaflavin-dependent oxidoreductase (nitroreductase family)
LTDRSVPAAAEAAAQPVPRLPPRWFVRGAWVAHRAIHRFTGGRRGLAPPREDGQFGYLRLLTVGRRSGQERAAILGYVPDGDAFVTLAMNGWASAEPAWWLNLNANPDASVELKGGVRRPIRARAAEGAERERLWALIQGHKGWGDVDGFAQRRSGETAVVVLEPRSA